MQAANSFAFFIGLRALDAVIYTVRCSATEAPPMYQQPDE
jgi:hypothetical protein